MPPGCNQCWCTALALRKAHRVSDSCVPLVLSMLPLDILRPLSACVWSKAGTWAQTCGGPKADTTAPANDDNKEFKTMAKTVKVSAG